MADQEDKTSKAKEIDAVDGKAMCTFGNFVENVARLKCWLSVRWCHDLLAYADKISRCGLCGVNLTFHRFRLAWPNKNNRTATHSTKYPVWFYSLMANEQLFSFSYFRYWCAKLVPVYESNIIIKKNQLRYPIESLSLLRGRGGKWYKWTIVDGKNGNGGQWKASFNRQRKRSRHGRKHFRSSRRQQKEKAG